MTDDIKAIRDALAAGPTPGPWTWWTSCSFRRLSSDITGKDGDVLHAAVHSDGVGDVVGTEATKGFIAACHPERIARLLDALEQASKDAERWRWFVQPGEKQNQCSRLQGKELEAAIDAAMSDAPGA